MPINTYRDLDTWKRGKELIVLVYTYTRNFPKEEIFGITNQMRRAVISITNNIAEGTGRQYKKDTLQFLYVANGSLNELESMVDVSLALEFIEVNNSILLMEKITETRKLLKGLIKYYQNADNLK